MGIPLCLIAEIECDYRTYYLDIMETWNRAQKVRYSQDTGIERINARVTASCEFYDVDSYHRFYDLSSIILLCIIYVYVTQY
jgi:hypothetical protein